MAPKLNTAPLGVIRQSLPLADWIDRVTMDAGLASTYDIPEGTGLVVLTSPDPFYVCYADVGTADSDPTGVVDGTSSLHVPASFECTVSRGSGRTLSLFCDSESLVTVGVYKV